MIKACCRRHLALFPPALVHPCGRCLPTPSEEKPRSRRPAVGHVTNRETHIHFQRSSSHKRSCDRVLTGGSNVPRPGHEILQNGSSEISYAFSLWDAAYISTSELFYSYSNKLKNVTPAIGPIIIRATPPHAHRPTIPIAIRKLLAHMLLWLFIYRIMSLEMIHCRYTLTLLAPVYYSPTSDMLYRTRRNVTFCLAHNHLLPGAKRSATSRRVLKQHSVGPVPHEISSTLRRAILPS
eukprot:284814882_2